MTIVLLNRLASSLTAYSKHAAQVASTTEKFVSLNLFIKSYHRQRTGNIYSDITVGVKGACVLTACRATDQVTNVLQTAICLQRAETYVEKPNLHASYMKKYVTSYGHRVKRAEGHTLLPFIPLPSSHVSHPLLSPSHRLLPLPSQAEPGNVLKRKMCVGESRDKNAQSIRVIKHSVYNYNIF